MRAHHRAALSRAPENAGRWAFKRTGDPSLGNYGDATILKTFGEVPGNLDVLQVSKSGMSHKRVEEFREKALTAKIKAGDAKTD